MEKTRMDQPNSQADIPSGNSSAIGSLIEQSMQELSVSKTDILKHMGINNLSKGYRRLKELVSGVYRPDGDFIQRLAAALRSDETTVQLAVEKTRADLENAQQSLREDEMAAWRQTFSPHAVFVTERIRPSPLFAAQAFPRTRLIYHFDTKGPEA